MQLEILSGLQVLTETTYYKITCIDKEKMSTKKYIILRNVSHKFSLKFEYKNGAEIKAWNTVFLSFHLTCFMGVLLNKGNEGTRNLAIITGKNFKG